MSREFRIFIFSFIFFIQGCSSATLEEICDEHLPGLGKEVASATPKVRGFLNDSGPNRQIASIKGSKNQTSSASSSFDPESRHYWKEWGVARLKEFQKIQDWLEEYTHDPETKRSLGHAADELVLFYSYANSGDIELMLESLQKVQTQQSQAQKRVCSKKI